MGAALAKSRWRSRMFRSFFAGSQVNCMGEYTRVYTARQEALRRNSCLEPLELSVTAAAKILRVSRQALNNVVNGKAAISPDMAIRLSKAFGSTPETWLQMQLAYDLAQARKHEGKIRVDRYESVPA